MEEKQIKTPPEISYIGMTHICNECEDDCKTACKGGVCRLVPKPTKALNPPAPNAQHSLSGQDSPPAREATLK